MPESYPFTIYSGILEPKHYKKIGSAIWLFLWFVSSTTKEVERDGVTWGIVLGNKPLKLNELAKIFDVNEKTVRRWLEDLEKHEYIKVTRAPYGLIVTVKNSKKFRNDRVDKNVQSLTERTKMSNPEWTKMSNLTDKNVHSNKDNIKILNNNTTTVTNSTQDSIDLIAEKYTALRSAQLGKIVYPTIKDYDAIAQIVAQGVPVSQTIEWLEQCFKDYEQRYSEGAINSFNYCKKFILDRYNAELQKEKIQKEGGNRGKEYSRGLGRAAKQSAKPEPIFGDIVGRLPRRTSVQ